MKRELMVFSLAFMSLTTFANQNVWVSEFKATERACQELTQGVTVEQQRKANVTLDADACYSWYLHSQLLAEPRHQETVFKAALTASQERVASVVATAIEAGMTPMRAVALAESIYPERRSEVIRGAIAAGADPSMVTEATAAGKSTQ